MIIVYCIMISLTQCFLLIIIESIVNILPNRNNETGEPMNVYSSIPFDSMNLSYFVSTVYIALLSQVYLIQIKVNDDKDSGKIERSIYGSI